MLKYMILLHLLTISAAYSYCKLNIRGDNICLNENALEIVQGEDKSLSYNLLTIKEINFPEITVQANNERGQRVVHIDDLSGNLTCEESSNVCKNQKVVIDSKCIDSNVDETHKIRNVYSMDMIEIKTGRLLFKKTRVIPVFCIVDLHNYLN